MRQTKTRRVSNTAWMYWTSVYSARTMKKSVFLMRERPALLTSYAQVILFYSVRLCPPPVKLMHIFILRSTKSSFDEVLSNQGGKLIGPCVTRDKLDLLLIARGDVSAPSNSSPLTARCCLWLSHMGHMKVRACRAAESPTVHHVSARGITHHCQGFRKRTEC